MKQDFLFKVVCTGTIGTVKTGDTLFVIEETPKHYIFAGKPGFWSKARFQKSEPAAEPVNTEPQLKCNYYIKKSTPPITIIVNNKIFYTCSM